MKKFINILGTKYSIQELPKEKDKLLKQADGYCDKTSKKIIIITQDDDCDLDNFDIYRKGILRHEILHAFLFESGLHENCKHPEFGHDEEMIDWFAKQYPKIKEVYKKLNIED